MSASKNSAIVRENTTAGQADRVMFAGERQQKYVLFTAFMTVACLHAVLFTWLFQPENTKPIQPPQVIAVSMVSVAAPASPQPTPPTPQPEQKPQPKQPEPKPKPVVKPVVKKMPTPKTTEPTPTPAQQQVETPTASAVSAPSQSQTTSNQAPAKAVNEEMTEASFRADYLNNPKPVYPMLAKSRGWQGKVMLRVLVSAAGASAKVEIEHSSGHELLDEQAIETVKTWKFVPAKRGENTVESWVIVPIVFSLND